MKLILTKIQVLLFLLNIFGTSHAQHTDSVRIFLYGIDNGGVRETLAFGYHPQATFCLDPHLGEVESPPQPPGFSLRWVNPRNYEDDCYGDGRGDIRGIIGLDLRSIPTFPHTDTFRVSFQPGLGGFPFTFLWEPIDVPWIKNMTLRYISKSVDMLEVNSHRVTDNTIRFARIIVQCDTVQYDTITNKKYILFHNYKNPFRNSTKITFHIPYDAIVTLKVYNFLGEEVAVLADSQFFKAHQHEIHFVANNIPSGIYLYHLYVQPIQGSKFSLMRKMLCIK